MVCSKCGYKNPKRYRFCASCYYGHGWAIPLDKRTVKSKKNCGICGRGFHYVSDEIEETVEKEEEVFDF